jgi:hypothetical protein
MRPGRPSGRSHDGVATDAREPCGLSDAVPLGQVLQDRDGGRLGEVAAVEWRPLALREAGAAGVTVELAGLLVLAVAAADREVAGAPSAVEGTIRVLAAEASEIVHEANWPRRRGRAGTGMGFQEGHSSYVQSLAKVQLARDTTVDPRMGSSIRCTRPPPARSPQPAPAGLLPLARSGEGAADPWALAGIRREPSGGGGQLTRLSPSDRPGSAASDPVSGFSTTAAANDAW